MKIVQGAIPWKISCLAVDFEAMVPVAVFDPGDPIAVGGGFAFVLALRQS